MAIGELQNMRSGCSLVVSIILPDSARGVKVAQGGELRDARQNDPGTNRAEPAGPTLEIDWSVGRLDNHVQMTLELVPLATGRVSVAPLISIPNTPMGTRIIGELTAFDLEGDRLSAHQHGVAAADWATMSPDGTLITIDIRVTLETDDGALLFAPYAGRIDMSQSPTVVYSTPRFDTGDERYAWLSRIQAVGKGIFSDDFQSITYEFYELR
jgi:Protein of unknown function (DUF3237)